MYPPNLYTTKKATMKLDDHESTYRFRKKFICLHLHQ